MIQIGSKTISNIQFGSKTSTELYLGSTKIWPEGGSTETWPIGTYLYTKNNEYITADQYSNGYTKDDIVGVYHYDTTMYEDNSGLLTNPQPILVAIDVPDMLISAGISEVKACRNNSTSIIGINTITFGDTGFTGVQTDWSGYENTQVLNNLLATGTSIVEDAPYVAATCFAVDGRQGYVPSSAELYRAMQFATEIDALIKRVGGTVMVGGGSTYTSSTKVVDSDGNGTVMFYSYNSSDGAGLAQNTDDVEVLVFFKPGPYTCDYYGVKFEGDSTNGTRIGNLALAKALPLQSKMKGCTLTSDGVVKYLDPKNWEYYEDGGSRDYSLNTMVELPEYWCYGANLTFGTGGDHIILVTENPTYGWHHFPKRYVSAYEATNVDNVLKSLATTSSNAVYPEKNIEIYTFISRARANNSDSQSWNIYTYDIHKQITWMFVTEYATRNTQDSFFSSFDPDGYRIGGLDNGFTTIGEILTQYGVGVTDTIGNDTGETRVSGGYMSRYRGIENLFGGLWKCVSDAGVSYKNLLIDQSYMPSTDFPTVQIGQYMTGGAYCSSLRNSTGNSLELFEDSRTTLEGSSSTYFADYQVGNAMPSRVNCIIGGCTNSSVDAGLFCMDCQSFIYGSQVIQVGTRLTYYPATQ